MYLDTAASTFVSNNVRKKLIDTLSIYGNPSSHHNEGYKSKHIIDEAKDVISNKIGCDNDELYFTSGATMSNNIIIQGFIRKYPDAVVLYSAIEHNDIIMMAEYFGEKIFKKIPVNKYGIVDLDYLKKLLCAYENNHVLVTIQAANSEIGTIQNIKEISLMIHTFQKTYFHSDFTQYIPYYKCNLKELMMDAISMSGQKIHCIKGVGLAYISNALSISPIIFGEQGLIGGTENVLGIACLGEAFKNLKYKNDEIVSKRDYFIKNIDKKLIGDKKNRLPNNISVLFDGIYSEEFIELLNEFDICASAGSACSSGNPNPSHVLKAIGLSDEEANSCIRFSIDENITYEEIDAVIKKIKIIENLG